MLIFLGQQQATAIPARVEFVNNPFAELGDTNPFMPAVQVQVQVSKLGRSQSIAGYVRRKTPSVALEPAPESRPTKPVKESEAAGHDAVFAAILDGTMPDLTPIPRFEKTNVGAGAVVTVNCRH